MARQLNTNPYANPDKIEDWGGKGIYFLLTDRFNDGDPTNNMDVDKGDLGKFHGGDLQGIIDKLDYIKELGMDSIWISPTMENQKWFVQENNTGYHYYWPIDFFKVDPHQGDMAKFEEMVTKSHEKGINVLLDIPLNHIAWDHPFRKDPTKKDWFHNIGDVQNWDDPYEAENGSIFGLPDLAQENPEVYKYLMDVAKFWIDKGIDGFRLDAVKNIHFPFWAKFNQEIHQYAAEKGKPDFYLIGECFDGSVDKVNQYQRDDMDGLFAYPEKFIAHEVLAHDGSMRKLAAIVDEGNKKYQSPELMGGFIDNHDTERFLSASGGDKRKLKLALDFLYTVNRIPTIYYGTEVGMDATPAPGQENVGWPATSRKDMEWGKDPDMLAHFKTLSATRNNSEALKHGDFQEMWVDDQIYAYGRNHPLEEAIVVLNNAHGTQERDIPLRPENQLIKDGTKLIDRLTGEKVTVKNGKIHVNLPAKEARIYFPEE
ncbi:MAG: Beta/alpha-amylase precursor [bacterium ADurb.Bin363]|nr:MAG: Beta/alpha-amylase precursor [bacterium ADurb.Bin363]